MVRDTPGRAGMCYSRPVRTWISLHWPAVLAAVLTFGLYAVSIGGTYVFDDVPIVQKDLRLRDPHQWGSLWKTDYFNGGVDNLYRPITISSYAIGWYLHGNRPWAFHLVNCILAAMVSAMVVVLCQRGGGTLAAGAVAGVLFAAMPVHVEAIANIVGRAELLSAIGVLGALILFARRPLTAGRIVAIFCCYVLAVLSKEEGLLIPLLLALWGVFVWRRKVQPVQGRERAAVQWLILSMLWVTAAYLIIREHYLPFDWDRWFLDWTMQPMVRAHGIDRLLIPIVIIGHYVRLLVWPTVLSPDYGGMVIGYVVHASNPYLWIGGIAIVACVVLILWCLRTGRGFLLVCLLGAAMSLGMVCNLLVILATIMGERLAYLPSAFLAMAVGVIVVKAPHRHWAPIVVVVVVAMSVRTVTYAARWNHPIAFWQQAVIDQPQSSKVYYTLGTLYEKRHEWRAAADIYARECKVVPDYWKAWNRRALVALHRNRLTDAQQYVSHALAIDWNPADSQTRDMIEEEIRKSKSKN